MNPRTTAILLVLAAALAAFVYFYEIRGEEARSEAEEQAKRLFADVTAEAIDSIALTTTDGAAARLERRDGAWRLVAPLDFDADAFAADGMATALADITSESVFDDPQPLEEYGLADSARVVHFEVGDEEHVLRLGRNAPVGAAAYAVADDGEAVYTVASYRAQGFAKSLDDLREKRILDFDRDAVHRIEASWPGGAVALERGGDLGDEAAEGAAAAEAGSEPAAGEAPEAAEEAPAAEAAESWRLVAPFQGHADADAIESLLTDLSFLRADGFVDEPSAADLEGFSGPAYRVVLRGGGAGSEPIAELAIGAARDAKRLVRGASASLYTIPEDRLADFPRELIAYRFKEVSRFPLTDAQQLQLFFQPEVGDPVSITATRGDEGWSSTPEAMAPGRLPRLVSELSRLQAVGVFAESAGEDELRQLGLAPPNAILTVFGAAPKGEAGKEGASLPVLAEVHLGNVKGDRLVAQRAGSPTVFELDYTLAEHVPVSLDAFRNRFLSEEEEGQEPDAAGEDFLSPTEESP